MGAEGEIMMTENLKYEVLPSYELFDEREHELFHTSYEIETAFYSTIERGEPEQMKAMLDELLKTVLIIGRLSQDSLRQMKYWAVCCITIATRYAIRGGLCETAAFNFADRCIITIDSMGEIQPIISFLISKGTELATAVRDSQPSALYPPAVRRCINLIGANLHRKLSLSFLGEKCGLSPDYLGTLFRKTTGMTVSEYIRRERLKEGARLLRQGMSISRAAYTLGFSSDSYFISCFRSLFGVTPKAFAGLSQPQAEKLLADAEKKTTV
ncbi:MAG: helix-turn-helix transcriptional regulator [Acutalibacteraceae bacterium]